MKLLLVSAFAALCHAQGSDASSNSSRQIGDPPANSAAARKLYGKCAPIHALIQPIKDAGVCHCATYGQPQLMLNKDADLQSCFMALEKIYQETSVGDLAPCWDRTGQYPQSEAIMKYVYFTLNGCTILICQVAIGNYITKAFSMCAQPIPAYALSDATTGATENTGCNVAPGLSPILDGLAGTPKAGSAPEGWYVTGGGEKMKQCACMSYENCKKAPEYLGQSVNSDTPVPQYALNENGERYMETGDFGSTCQGKPFPSDKDMSRYMAFEAPRGGQPYRIDISKIFSTYKEFSVELLGQVNLGDTIPEEVMKPLIIAQFGEAAATQIAQAYPNGFKGLLSTCKKGMTGDWGDDSTGMNMNNNNQMFKSSNAVAIGFSAIVGLMFLH